MDTPPVTGSFAVEISPERHAAAVANRRSVLGQRQGEDDDQIVRLDGMAQQLAVERQRLEQELAVRSQQVADLQNEVEVIRGMNADLQRALDEATATPPGVSRE